MFLTLAYVLVEVYHWYFDHNSDMKYLRLLRSHIRNGSVMIKTRTGSARLKDANAQVSTLIGGADGSYARKMLANEGKKQIESITPKVGELSNHAHTF